MIQRFTRTRPIWMLGLDGDTAEDFRRMAGSGYSLRTWPAGTLPEFTDPGDMESPCLICFTLAACREFLALPYERTAFLDLTPKLILLEKNAPQSALEEAIDLGAGDIIRAPLTTARLSRSLRKAAEADALQRDIRNMTREVFIERELLERKNSILSFIVNFLTNISDCRGETELLAKSYSCLQRLFPVVTMSAALITRDADGRVNTDLFIAAPPGSRTHEAWRIRLLEAAQSLNTLSPKNPSAFHLVLPGTNAGSATPSDGHILTLPVHMENDLQFFLMLLTPMERNMSRDQAQALDCALRHMALNLRNARRYREMCAFADKDPLTGAYNRRFLEQTLQNEVARHIRYKGKFSMLLLDIDFFKKINDTWGHLKGDDVLRSIAATIMATIRQADCCIRYGGEEFLVLLPHTSEGSAARLADRLRKKIERLSFPAGGESFSVTASIGVSSLAPGESKDGTALTNEADMALYHAKSTGRNKVSVYTAPEALAASM